MILFFICLIAAPAQASPWHIENKRFNLLLDYRHTTSRQFFDANRIAKTPKDAVADQYAKEKHEGKAFLEYGIPYPFTLLGSVEGGEVKTFTSDTFQRWLGVEVGTRASLELYGGTYAFSLETHYSYRNYQNTNSRASQRDGMHFARVAVTGGRSWVLHPAFAIYIINGLSWERAFRQERKNNFVLNALLGMKLEPASISQSFLLTQEVIHKRLLGRMRLEDIEEYLSKTSFLLFFSSSYGVELGYIINFAGKNIAREQGGKARLWFKF